MRFLKRAISVMAVMALTACGGGGVGGGGGQAVSVHSVGGGMMPQLSDSSPTTWRNGHPYNFPVHGIDISRWQGEIDWRRVRSSGISFAFIKSTEGGDHLDPNFHRYWRQAGQARIPRGAYHYYYFCRTGAEQAAWFIRNVPRERGALPPVLDLEWTHSKTCPRRPGTAEIIQQANIFLDIVGRHYGKRPIVYTTVDFYRDNNLGRNLRAEFWLRSVADHPRMVYPGQRWSFWQYTGTGRVPGIGGDVDINVFAGDVGQWRQWLANHLQ